MYVNVFLNEGVQENKQQEMQRIKNTKKFGCKENEGKQEAQTQHKRKPN